jgi:hypothetical protein
LTELWLGVADTRGSAMDKPNGGTADNLTTCFLGRHLTFAGWLKLQPVVVASFLQPVISFHLHINLSFCFSWRTYF